MIDVHCHLNFKAFENDYEEVIRKAFDTGVTKIINVGTSLETSQKAVELAEKYENLYAIVGIHPHHADKLNDGWIDKLEQIAKNNKVVAIGEIGMDYYSYSSNGIVDPKIQKDVFEKQIELAHKLGLPLQIHNRQAGEDVVSVLKENKKLLQEIPGMFHCFAATREVLNEILNMGFYVGFDGNITYEGLAKGETVRLEELCKLTPIDRIVTETDAPYLPPIPYRGSRNEPSYVIITAEFISKIKAVSLAELKQKTTENVSKLFNI